jgi:transposase-like protein
MTDLTDPPMFHDDAAARAHFESILWPNGPFCPHCGAVDGLTRLQGKSHRSGLLQCNACKGHFTVTNGSIMERSHVPLSKWALAFHLMAASKKGVSAHQLHRMLKVNYRTAWFMEHRIRECMSNRADTTPIGGEGAIGVRFLRYNNRVRLGVDDAERTPRAIRGAQGKPLMYQEPSSRPAP